MRKSLRSRLASATCALLAACGVVDPSNGFDRESPPTLLRRSELSGTLVLVPPGTPADGLPLQLIDEAGAPVTGANKAPLVAVARRRPADAADSNAAEFAFTDLAPGTYRVAPGDDPRFRPFQAPTIPAVTLGPGEKRSLGALVFARLDEGTGRVRGFVKLHEAQGGPREVKLYRQLGRGLEVRAQLRTDAAGGFDRGDLPPGRYALSAEAAGFTPDFRVGFDLGTEPGGLSNEVVFEDANALVLYPVTAVVVPDVQRVFGTYYTREQSLPVQVLAFGAMNEMRLSSDVRFLDAGGEELAFTPYAAAATVSLPEREGPLEVYAQFRHASADGFSFTTDVFRASVVRDATAPVVRRVAVRGLPVRADGKLYVRDGTQPLVLEIEGNDSESAVASIALHHDSAGSPGLPELLSFTSLDAPGGLMRTEATLGLTEGEGTKTAWVYLRDRAGNTSDPLNLEIEVDAKPPDVAPLAVANGIAGNVLDGLVARVVISIPAACADATVTARNDCPVSYRLGAKPMGAGLALPVPAEGWAIETIDGAARATLFVSVPFQGVHGQVIAFEGVFEDAAGNVARVESANYTLRLVGTVAGRVLVEGVSEEAPNHGGVTLSVFAMGGPQDDASKVAEGTSGADGRFRIDSVPAGRYLVVATRRGLVRAEFTTEVRAKETADSGTLRLATARGLLAGRFVRADLREAAGGNGGISVSIRAGATTLLQLTTADDGTWVTPPPGVPVTFETASYTLIASTPGYVTRAIENVAVDEGVTNVVQPTEGDAAVPEAVELAKLSGDFDLCAAADPCIPLAFTKDAALRVRLRNTVNVSKIRVKARAAFAENDPSPWVDFTSGLLVPVSVAGADGSVPVFVQVVVDGTPASLRSQVVLDTNPPSVTAFLLERGSAAVFDGFTNEANVRALVSANNGIETDVAPLQGAFVAFLSQPPARVPAGAVACQPDLRCPVPLPRESGSIREGTHVAYAFACDAAGNCSAPASAKIVYDATPSLLANGVTFAPASSAIRVVRGQAYTRSPSYELALGAGSAKTAAGQPLLDITGTAIADVAGWRLGERQQDNSLRFTNWQAFAPAAMPGSTTRVGAPTLATVDATYRVFLQLRDAAGNATDAESAPLSYELTLDQSPPATSFALNGGAAFTTNPVVQLAIAPVPRDPGPAESVQLSTDPVFARSETRSLPLSDVSLPLGAAAAPGGDGAYTVYARFTDAAGNVADRAASIVLDRTKPVVISARCGSCVADAAGSLYASSTDLTLYVAASDNSGRVEKIRTTIDAQPAVTRDAEAGFQLVLPDADGAHTVKVEVLDPAGNVSDPSTTALKLDRAKPQFAVKIAGGAASTTTAAVEVFIDASSAGEVASMQVSNVPTLSGAQKLAFQPTVRWALADPDLDGDKTVFVRLTDFAGNEQVQSGTIRLRATSTIEGTVRDPNGTAIAGVTVALTGTTLAAQATVTRSATTDSSGRFSFTGLREGTYAVAFSIQGFEVQRVPAIGLAAGSVADASVSLRRATGGLAGRVVPSAGGTGLALATSDAQGFVIAISGCGLTAPVTTTTNAGGQWSVPGLALPVPSSACTITASLQGFTSATDSATLVSATNTAVPDLAPAVAAFAFSGSVTVEGAADSSGVTAQLSGVAFNGSSFAKTADATSNPSGAYSFSSIPAGSYTVSLTKSASYVPARIAPVVVAPPPAALPNPTGTLARATGGLTGRVVPGPGATGLSILGGDAFGVTVTVSDASLAGAWSAVTDAQGRYAINGVPAPLLPGSTYTITASKPGFQSATATAAIAAGTAPTTVADLALPAAGQGVTGCVTVPAPASDSTGVVATLSGLAFNGASYTRAAAAPSANGACSGGAGSYAFTNVPDGSYAIALSRAGFDAARVDVVVAGVAVTAPAATLSRARGTLQGTVLGADGGTGLTPELGGALVAVTGADLLGATIQATTDSSGSFVLAGIPVSPSGAAYTITVSKPNYVANTTRTASVLANATVTSQPVTLTIASGTLSGTVRLPNPPALDSSGVTATISGTAFNGASVTRSADAASSSTGAYVFTKVPPGAYTVQLAASGFVPAILQGLSVAAGVTTTVPQRMLARASGGLYGRAVLNANGSGLALGAADLLGASVVVTGTGLVGSYATTTDSAGNWAIPGIPVAQPAGAYTVTASKAGFQNASGTATVIADQQTQVSDLSLGVAVYALSGTVTVTGAASNAGVVATLSGVAFNGAAYAKSGVAPSNAAGSFSFAALPAGSYTVTLTGNASYVATVLPPVVVSPPPAALPTLEGTLVRASGSFTGRVVPGPGATGLTLGPADAAGFLVVVTHASLPASGYAAYTDSLGKFVINAIPAPPVPGATYTVRASKAGFVDATTLAAVSPGTTVPVPDLASLVAGHKVEGVGVVGSPAVTASGTTVEITGIAFNGLPFTRAASVAATGTAFTWLASNVPDSSGSYVVTARATGFEPREGSCVVQGADVVVSDLTVARRAMGRIVGAVTFSSGTTGFLLGGPELAGALVTLTGADLSSPVRAATDASGAFAFEDVPVNILGTYSVSAAKDYFSASAPVTVNVSASSSSTVAGLALTLEAQSVPVVVELHDRVNDGDPVSYAAVPVTLSGTAFNGASLAPVTQTTSGTTGETTFANLPPGNYSLSATLAQHTQQRDAFSLFDFGRVEEGVEEGKRVLRFYDVAGPTAPVVSIARATPTSSATTALTLVSASTDPTLPDPNFRGYSVMVCASSQGCTTMNDFNPGSSLVPLTDHATNVIYVWATDWNGNVSSTVVLPPIQRESATLPAPTAVHVDNRPGAVRVSWKAVTPSGTLPVKGYRVYYGPVAGSQPGDFKGTFSNQGPSPVDAGANTEITLSGLADNSSFFVAVAAYDGVVDPSPNVSPLSARRKANPGKAPFDRSAVATVGANTVSMDVRGDSVFVVQGSSAPRKVLAYRYDGYDDLNLVGTYQGSSRASRIVADEHRVLYLFDPAGTGVDVIDAGNPAAMAAIYSGNLDYARITQLAPVRRLDIGGANRTHGVFTFVDTATSKHRLATYAVYPNHLDLDLQHDGRGTVNDTAVDLALQAAPTALAVHGQFAFTLHAGAGSLSYFTIPASFRGATVLNGTRTYTSTGSAGDMVVEWPHIYFTTGRYLYSSLITATSPLIVGPPQVVATLRADGQKLRVAGDLLLVGEWYGYGNQVVEAFSLAEPGVPRLVGAHERFDSNEFSSPTYVLDMGVSGPNLFLRHGSFGAGDSSIEAVEIGSPRLMTYAGTTRPDITRGSVAVRQRGGRGHVLVTDTGGTYKLLGLDMKTAFAGNFDVQASAPFTSSYDSLGTGFVYDNTMAAQGDYVYVPRGAVAVDVYDTSKTLSGAGPIFSFATPKRVQALAAANDYLVLAVDGGTTYAQVWDVSASGAPQLRPFGNIQAATSGLSVDVQGQYAYFGTKTGLCVVDFFAGWQMGCQTIGAIVSVKAAGSKLYAAHAYGGPIDEFSLAAPASPVLLRSFGGASDVGGQQPQFAGLQKYGPYLVASHGGVRGIVAFDVSSTSRPSLVGAFSPFSTVTWDPVSMLGSLGLAPDAQQGLHLMRWY